MSRNNNNDSVAYRMGRGFGHLMNGLPQRVKDGLTLAGKALFGLADVLGLIGRENSRPPEKSESSSAHAGWFLAVPFATWGLAHITALTTPIAGKKL